MRSILLTLLVAAATASAQATAPQPTLVLENGRVIVGDGSVLERASVVIAGERIMLITDRNVTAPNARRIDARGRTILPGLIDAHVHLTIGPSVRDSVSLAAYINQTLPQTLQAFLEHGITTVRSTGDYWPWIGRVRERIATGQLPGPRVLTAGPVVTYRNAHPATSVCFRNPFCRSTLVAEVDDVEQARATVRRLASEGVDFVKVVSDSLITPAQIPDDVITAVITQAHTNGLTVVAHVAEAVFISKLAETGMDGFVHATQRPIPVQAARELARELVRQGTPVTTTLTAAVLYGGMPAQSAFEAGSGLRSGLDAMVRALAAMAEEGTQLVVGTDWCPCSASLGTALDHAAFKAGSATLTEMQMLSWGGVTNQAIIAAATVNSARALGLSQLGTLKPGKIADLVVIDGNPLQDITALRNVRTVVKGGTVVVHH